MLAHFGGFLLGALFAPLVRGQDPANAAAAGNATEVLGAGIARQAALDRAGFSPGVIDGKIGPKSKLALREFQSFHKLTVSGEFDAATLAALRVADSPVFNTYTVTSGDIADVGEFPSDWNLKAKLDRLRYESRLAMIAERGHCKKELVELLNPGVAIDKIAAGATVKLPNVEPLPASSKPAKLEVDLGSKVVRARDAADRTVMLFHCSIAADDENLPSGKARVAVIVFDPTYSFKPEKWPEVKNVFEPLLIPPGPRNPVGLCWIGLSKPGYGIHGTPQPEMIGKTGSHGCIRLANWDALRLGKAVTVETPVEFIDK